MRSHRVVVGVFVAASFLGSALLFMVQPMVARMLLPLAGGTPSLWNTSLVFFQLALLAGYAYAHLSTRRFGLVLHPLVQIGLLALPLLVLPVAVDESWRLATDTSPMLWVFAVLALIVGLPFFALSTSSPTLQRWFAATDHPAAHNPYFLYAAGNAGSVLALLSYPVLLEPLLSLDAQTRLWTGLYVVFFLASAAAALITRRQPGQADAPARLPRSHPIAPARRTRWVLWSFVPSALMLGVTRHLSTDVASVPLLWIVPLFLYLVTFIIAFGRDSKRRTVISGLVVQFGVVPLLLSFVLRDWSLVTQVAVHLGWFFFAALLGHGRLSEDRPEPDRLTEFYLWISVGGVAGGAFAALVAPVVFTTVLEYPIAIALGLGLTRKMPTMVTVPNRMAVGVVGLMLVTAWFARSQNLVILAILMVMMAVVTGAVSFPRPGPMVVTVAVALLAVLIVPPSGVVAQDRSFFGVYRVEERPNMMQLTSGTTIHGTQRNAEPGLPPAATSYYYPEGPLGQVITAVSERRTVGVIGLGVGAIAAYARPGDEYTFFEIDPTVVEIAEDPAYFTYLSSAPGEIDVVIGDGRLAVLDHLGSFDVLVVDAFNSDAIPVHLLTMEAIETYRSRLSDGGVIAVHISNRHFTLQPVLGRIAAELGLAGRVQYHAPTTAAREEGGLSSLWVVLAEDARSLAWADQRWDDLPADGPLWTDDYSDILRVLRF